MSGSRTGRREPAAYVNAAAGGRAYGTVTKIAGPMVAARGMRGVRMSEIVRIGGARLMGEVIRIDGDSAYVQSYEDTSGLCPGDPVLPTGETLLVTLGPGLLGSVFDGIERPLETLAREGGAFIERGVTAEPLPRDKTWDFRPVVRPGDAVEGGDVLGEVEETPGFTHRILVPPFVRGRVAEISGGFRTAFEPVAALADGTALSMAQKWSAKTPRPVKRKVGSSEPFVTRQRVLDTLFPIALGGTACLPGGFGTGKTVLEQSLAKYAAVDVIVYVGCGERGNEMTDVLTEFPALTDPRTGGPLMNRTVLVANTSNMPVAAREASIYVGITIAEYFRDMGYDAAVMVDSTSRWGEALREISSRLEEMPGEEGYPPYLASRLASFYERAGKAECLGRNDGGTIREGSVTVIGAVSPPGGDFSEPVTQSTMRFTGALWALDSSLANRRHYPSVNWHRSYTLYSELLAPWFARNAGELWNGLSGRLSDILGKEAELQEIVQLVGPDALREEDRFLLDTSRMLRETYLQQNGMSETDASCSLEKQYGMLTLFFEYYDLGNRALAGKIPLDRVLALPEREELASMRNIPESEFGEKSGALRERLTRSFGALGERKRP